MLAVCSALCLQQPLNAVSAKPFLSSSTRIKNSFLADSIRRRVLLQTFLFNIAGTFLASESTKAIEETSVDCVTDLPITDKVYFDVAIDRQPVGRIVIGLYSADVPVGAKRFAEIAAGSRGVSYRKKEFDKITPSYVQNAGVRNFSLSGGIAEAAKFTGGETVDALLPELETQNRKCPNSTKNVVNAVSIMVKDPSRPLPKQKLIAKDGKFEVIEEEFGPSLNGTQFIIVTKASHKLDHGKDQ
ncbi:hypothetical protein KP509_1Z008200 [Ceratopteris richardii]|nr:hypothetical protein KP509_1Z008200 [Ceratopteris richardii]